MFYDLIVVLLVMILGLPSINKRGHIYHTGAEVLRGIYIRNYDIHRVSNSLIQVKKHQTRLPQEALATRQTIFAT